MDCTPALNVMCCCFVVVVVYLFAVVVVFWGECCLIQVVCGVAGVVVWYSREWGWGVYWSCYCVVMSSLVVSELLEFTQCHYWSLCSDQKTLQGY